MLEDGQIKAVRGYQNISYILDDAGLFNYSNYRFLKGREKNGLAKCIKVMQNGRIKLVYFMGECRPLSTMYRCMNFPAFCNVLDKIFRVMLGVKENGFLSCYNLDLDFNHIFLDSKGQDLRMVFLPVNGLEEDEKDFEFSFRCRCEQLIRMIPTYSGPLAEQVCEVLTNPMTNLEELDRFLMALNCSGGVQAHVYEEDQTVPESTLLAANMRLVSQADKLPLTLHIHKSSYVIGKISTMADGVIADSTISRKHCRISFINGDYYVEDLDSRNGTYVNGGHRISSHQRVKIEDGDTLMLANLPFKVEI